MLHRPAPGDGPATSTAAVSVISLRSPEAADPALSGAKAANLARAAVAGLPVLPGIVLTTGAATGTTLAPETTEALRRASEALCANGPGPLVVRSSSTVEDIGTSSMAGQFTSVLGVEGWEALLEAVARVLASAERPHDARTAARPMAVLVQPQLEAVCGGVLFGVDPVTGTAKHLAVDAVPQGPDVVVSGEVVASHYVLSRRGRVIESLGPPAPYLTRSRRRRLAALAAKARDAFGGPQDIEWAFGPDDHLWLLQSRPVTAVSGGQGPRSHLFGPGPVAETFPAPLRRLEADLWVEPLRLGLVGALEAIGAVPAKRVASSPGVVVVGGRVAIDLELVGAVGRRRFSWSLLNPAGPARRLLAAWRVGRLRAAMAPLTSDLLAAVDRELASVGPLDTLDDGLLLELIEAARGDLRSLHGYEMLAGMLLGPAPTGATAVGLGLEALARARRQGLSDEEAAARYPAVLALAAPAVAAPLVLPWGSRAPDRAPTLADLGPREALRLRCRWAQELTVRAAEELGGRLTERGTLARPGAVADLSLVELRAVVDGASVPEDLMARAAVPAGPPLPTSFRLGAGGVAVAEQDGASGPREGMPAGGRRVVGTVRQAGSPGPPPGTTTPGGGDILVIGVLDPALAGELAGIVGLVSETGTPLSHLAILAREMGVATAVAVPDARRRFPAGTRVLVDGATGEVRALSAEEGEG